MLALAASFAIVAIITKCFRQRSKESRKRALKEEVDLQSMHSMKSMGIVMRKADETAASMPVIVSDIVPLMGPEYYTNIQEPRYAHHSQTPGSMAEDRFDAEDVFLRDAQGPNAPFRDHR